MTRNKSVIDYFIKIGFIILPTRHKIRFTYIIILIYNFIKVMKNQSVKRWGQHVQPHIPPKNVNSLKYDNVISLKLN